MRVLIAYRAPPESEPRFLTRWNAPASALLPRRPTQPSCWSWRGGIGPRWSCSMKRLPRLGGVAGLQRLAATTPDSRLVINASRYEEARGVRAVLAGAAGTSSVSCLLWRCRGLCARRCKARRRSHVPSHGPYRARARRARDAADQERADSTRMGGARPADHRRLDLGDLERVGCFARHRQAHSPHLGVHSREGSVARAHELCRHQPQSAGK
jgi:hypothetical protein